MSFVIALEDCSVIIVIIINISEEHVYTYPEPSKGIQKVATEGTHACKHKL